MAQTAPAEWSGSPDPSDPDNFWIDDVTGERVCAATGRRFPGARMTLTDNTQQGWQPKAFRVLRSDRAANNDVKAGDTVYDCRGHDYGCANDDTRMTGIEHTSVTFDATGDYPFFTIPKADLEAIPPAPGEGQ